MKTKQTIVVLALFFAATLSKNITAQTFTEQTGISLQEISSKGSVAWIDYDNDGYLDIFLTGRTKSIIYKNNRDGTFIEQNNIFLHNVEFSSVAWGDYNNDGYLDILLTGRSNSQLITKIYKNNSGKTFTESTDIVLTGVFAGSAVWGDYDNDGRLDILLTGNGGGESTVSKVYRNGGDGSFTEQLNISLTGVSGSSVAWGDYNNDGYLDILLTGQSSSGNISKIYKNNGNGSFTEKNNISLPGVDFSSVAWGDYDNDRYMDFIITGYLGNGTENRLTKIFKNNGNDSFTEQAGWSPHSLISVDNGSVAWGDYDNNDYLDILIIGEIGRAGYEHSVTYIMKNEGNGTFTLLTTIPLTGFFGKSAWGDYDNDGDLDILVNNRIFRNDSLTTPNLVPASPMGLVSLVNGDYITLKWRPVNNDSSYHKSISYNVRVGTTKYGNDVVSSASTSDGNRLIPAMGNAQLDTFFLLKNITKGKYYWSVQAIDNSFAGSDFSIVDSFNYNANIQSDWLAFSNVLPNSLTLTWNRGNGENCLVFVKETKQDSAVPENNTTYVADTSFGSGSQIGTTGWYCVYNGNKNTVSINNLKAQTYYSFHILEYTGSIGNEVYYTTTGSGNPAIQQTSLFSEQTSISLTGISGGTVSWGDYNNDGFLDILLTGATDGGNLISKIYKNNGDGSFTEQNDISLAGSTSGTWGDYNNDGYLDILLAGSNYARIYKNNGDGSFTEHASIGLDRIKGAAWGDYDNDGDLDILLTYGIVLPGQGGASYQESNFTLVCKNYGDGVFTKQASLSFGGGFYGSQPWIDYDNNGYRDVLLTGYFKLAWWSVVGIFSYYWKVYSPIYKNDGSSVFKRIDGIQGVADRSAAWGDYDNDGYPDLLLTGNFQESHIGTWGKENCDWHINTQLYKNNGNGTFTSQTDFSLPGVTQGSVIWGDLDNDGNLDIVLTGKDTNNNKISKVYKNNGDGTFIEKMNISLPGVSNGSVALGDYDNDGDIDILICGATGSSRITKIYRNDTITSNQAPIAPTNLIQVVDSANVLLQWNKVKGDTALNESMSYNVRVGTTSGGSEVVSPHSAVSGFRRLSGIGNAQLDTMMILKNLKKGTYYWSVQAVDNCFAGGAFSTEQSFVIDTFVQASGLSFSNIQAKSVCLKWKRGNGDKCAVFVKKDSGGYAIPANNTTYIANPMFGMGTQIGSTGWYCVYNGVLDTVTVTNLKVITFYTIHVIEYTGDQGAEDYFTTIGSGNPAIQQTNLFTEQQSISLEDIASPHGLGDYHGITLSEWGDYNNDGNLDLLLTGFTSTSYSALHSVPEYFPFTKIYRNNGNGTFTKQTSIVIGAGGGSASWVDYDNDGFIDIIITGVDGVIRILKNNKDGSFTEQTGNFQTGTEKSAWGDYNNDGNLDILLTGWTQSSPRTQFTKVYKNNGEGSFTEQTGVLLTSGDPIFWVDCNSDGYLDIFLKNHQYKNNGDGSFSEQSSILLRATALGDYNNDGFQDILLYDSLFNNNGDFTFTETPLPDYSGGSVIWGDCDNDGYLNIIYNSRILNRDGSFTYQSGIDLTGTLGDYDNDGDLDLVKIVNNNEVNGVINNTGVKIYRNDIDIPNQKPTVPTNLKATINDSIVTFTWDKATDAETPQDGLTYNLYVCEGDTSKYLRSPEAFRQTDSLNGRRLVAQFGTIQYNPNGYVLKGLPSQFKWSVQAIDASMQGGPFATEQNFPKVITVQASQLSFSNVQENSVCLNWKRGNGDSCVAFVKEASEGNAVPIDNRSYSANLNFGIGSQIDSSGWYCVYNGSADSITITNLKAETWYVFQVMEYMGTPGTEEYFTTTAIGNPAVQQTNVFTERIKIPLTVNTKGIKLYPNPANDFITIEGLTGKTKGLILSIEGKVIRAFDLDRDNKNIDISILSNGIYILKLRNALTTFEGKFVKNR